MSTSFSKQEIIQYVTDHPAGRVKIAFADIDGVLRGKYISREKFLSAVESGTSFCDVIFGWDSGDVAYDDVKFTGWHTGYPDTPARIDLGTFRKIPWENGLPFFLGELIEPGGQPSAICPRQLIKRIQEQAAAMGYTVKASQEFEWYNFQETPDSLQRKNFQQLVPLTPGMFGYSILRQSQNSAFFDAIFDQLTRFDVPIEGLHTETGPGTLEAAIRYSGLTEAADRAVLFKTAVKELAYRHGIMATFMAKVNELLPGCGGHVHQSLWDAGGERNLFAGDEADQAHAMNRDAPGALSPLLEQYIAGQLHCLPYLLPLFAPTINSYKRLVEGAWAPTTLTWGMDNRTVALRVLNTTAAATRLETRVIGADVNPYLAMAGAIGSGLYGIRHQLKLERPVTVGNGYADRQAGRLPATLEHATAQMKGSPIAAEILGSGFAEHFVATREWEWRQSLKAVTDWEMKRYFEII